MEQDDFCTTVGASRVLTAEEALDVVLHMKNATTRNKLTFSGELRVGTWTDNFFTDTILYHHGGYRQQQQFTLTIPKGQIVISSVYFLNASGNQLLVHLTRNGNVRKLENRLYQGQQLYEAVFDPPVRVKSGDHVITFTYAANEYITTRIEGQNTLQYKDITISMIRKYWYHVVGFKLRKT